MQPLHNSDPRLTAGGHCDRGGPAAGLATYRVRFRGAVRRARILSPCSTYDGLISLLIEMRTDRLYIMSEPSLESTSGMLIILASSSWGGLVSPQGRLRLSSEVASRGLKPDRARVTTARLACPDEVCLSEAVIRGETSFHLLRRQRRCVTAVEVVSAATQQGKGENKGLAAVKEGVFRQCAAACNTEKAGVGGRTPASSSPRRLA